MAHKKNYCIVGLGMTDIGHLDQFSVLSLEVEAARRAIEDAGLEANQMGAAIQMLSDVGGGIRARHDDSFARALNLPVNLYMENVGRGGEYAAMALVSATRLIELGIADYVLCSGARDDWSRSRARKLKGLVGAPYEQKEGTWGIMYGESPPAFHGLFATRHMHEYGTTSEHFGHVALSHRKWANKNPQAIFHNKPLTIEEHQNSPVVVWPFHLLDICVQSDGGTAFIVTTKDRAKDLKKPAIGIEGIGFGEQMESLWWDKKNYTTLPVKKSKEAAFRQAGIELADIDVVQFYDCFTPEVIFQLEDYGFCEKGEGGPFVKDGNIAPGGTIPVNTGGGLLSSHHLGNLTGLAEAIIQLRNEGGDRQVEDAEIALVSGHGGEIVSGQMCSIHSSIILRRL